MATVYIYPPLQVTVSTGDLATSAKQDEQTTLLTDIESNTDGLEGSLTSIDSKVLTDAQLRATPIDVNVPGTIPVSGPLTDTELRATAVPVSAASLPLPSGASTSADQTTGNNSLSSIDTKVSALSRLSGSLVPTSFDQIDLTYVTVGNGIGEIETATYKLASSTVKTLTLSYDANDKLSSVVAS